MPVKGYIRQVWADERQGTENSWRPIRGKNEGYSERNRSHLISSGTQLPPHDKRGVALIFRSFSSPPPHPSHPSDHQTLPTPPLRPINRSLPYLPCNTGWSDTKFSVTSGRKPAIATAPPAITPRLYPSCQDVQNLLFSFYFSSPNYHHLHSKLLVGSDDRHAREGGQRDYYQIF